MKWLRRTRGVERVNMGWMREWKTVGMKRLEGQR